MNIIIIPEIYGKTAALEDLANSLDATIIDPYQGTAKSFVDEAQAYQCFIDECGHQAYTALVKSAIESIEGQVIVLGFSAGASAAWKATECFDDDKITHVIGFYPSQIRHHLDVKPACPVTMIFPQCESHFDVDQVIQSVSESAAVECVKTAFKHGFMNPLSTNYNDNAFAAFGKFINNRDTLTNINHCRHLLQSAKD